MLKRISVAVVAVFATALATARAAEGQDKSVQSNVDTVVKSYLAVQKLLADDKTEGVEAELKKVRESAAALSEGAGDEKLKKEAKAVAKEAAVEPKDIKEARKTFKPLSAAVIGLVNVMPPTTDAAPALFEASCPMVKANWLQDSKEIANPYMGKEMLGCGKVEREIKAAKK